MEMENMSASQMETHEMHNKQETDRDRPSYVSSCTQIWKYDEKQQSCTKHICTQLAGKRLLRFSFDSPM